MSKELYQDMVYKCPGPHSRKGGTFDTKGVNSKEEHAAALKDGWFNTLPEAIAGKSAAAAVEALPTRVELEQKAKELSVKFTKGMKDEELSAAVAQALGA